MSAADLWNGNFTPLPAILALMRPRGRKRLRSSMTIDRSTIVTSMRWSIKLPHLCRETMSAGTNDCHLCSDEHRVSCDLSGRIACGCRRRSAGPSSTPGQLLTMLEDCAARIVFVDHDTVRPAGADAMHGKLVNLEGVFGGDPFAIWAEQTCQPAGRNHYRPGVAVQYHLFLRNYPGAPKGIVQSHAMRFGFAACWPPMTIRTDGLADIDAPVFEHHALASVLPTLSVGGTLVLMKKFDAKRFGNWQPNTT